MPQISGITKDALGVPCSAVVDVRRRDNGALVARTVSDPVSGAFMVETADTAPHVVTRHVAPVIEGDANWAITSVRTPLKDDFDDTKGMLTVASGAVSIDTTTVDPFGETGGVATFAGGKIDYLDGDTLHPSGDFTLSFWFKPASSSRMGLVAYGADFYMGIDYGYNGVRNINMWASSNGSSWDILQSDGAGANSGIGALSLILGEWNYIKVTRSGNTWRSFVHGNLDREVVASGTPFRGTRGLRIGTWGSNEFPAAGSITDFVIVNGVAEHTASFTPPTSRSLGPPKPGTPTANAQVFDNVIPGTPTIPEA